MLVNGTHVTRTHWSALALASLVALAAPLAPAHAADMDPPIFAPEEPPPPPAPSYNWTRCYGGFQLGTQLTMTHLYHDSAPTGATGPYFDNFALENYITNPVGPGLGGQVGCNVTSGPMLFGIELGAWYSPSDSEDCKTMLEPTAICVESRKRFNGDLTLRAGYLWDDRTLTYFKGGFAMTESSTYEAVNVYGLELMGTGSLYGFKKNHHAVWTSSSDWEYNFAPTAGFGIEYALSPSWTVRGEFDVTYVPRYDTVMTIDSTRFINWDERQYGPKPTKGDKIGIHPKELITNLKIGMNYMF